MRGVSLREHRGKLVALVALLALGGWLTKRWLDGAEVQAASVARAEVVQTVLVSGRVLPPAEVELVARVEAPTLEVLADEGDAVEAGQVLARLDATVVEAELARAQAALARAQATSGRARQIAPRVAQQTLTQARVQLEEAERALEQAERLVASGAWPSERADAARDAARRARSQVQSSQLELTASRGADRRAANASVEEAVATVAVAEQHVAQTTIRAPVAGTVLERALEEGDTTRPGALLFRLAADGPPILSVDPDERHLSQLEVGQRADVSSDAYPDRPFQARVSFIAPAVDPERGTVEVRLLPTVPIDVLRPNMTVSVEIEVARAEDALLVPLELVQNASTDAPWVWTSDAGRLARRAITLGLRGDERVQVTDGLSEGERILRVIDASLAEGARVRVVDE